MIEMRSFDMLSRQLTKSYFYRSAPSKLAGLRHFSASLSQYCRSFASGAHNVSCSATALEAKPQLPRPSQSRSCFQSRCCFESVRKMTTASSASGSSVPAHGRENRTGEHAGSDLEEAEVISDAVLESIEPVSPTVRLLTLRLLEPDAATFRFCPGMWVDFYIPAIDKVGGYTIISLPDEVPILRLAVKVTKHPPAAWIGNAAKPGDKVMLRVGGNFHISDILPLGSLLPETDIPQALRGPPLAKVDHLVLIAGGIGITPLYPMILQWVKACQTCQQSIETATGEATFPTHLTLMYTAKSRDELVFLSELNSIATAVAPRGTFQLSLHLTEGTAMVGVKNSRISLTDLEAVLATGCADTSKGKNALCCICGPPQMTEEIKSNLIHLGVDTRQVRFEQWW
eukprot:TRINITY_DN109098_c0_g1_i1.p1 TRINITY_DN109098_c0_g1~~TRINITY_DN109098_c0_g1_i1.p1  ORF type:complete len:399 (+),score=63.69 TRINITY_DN109098_c0_g1_i1:101-1297(+)